MKPCIIIPVYNHEHAIASVLAALKGYGVPCLLIDDGSSAACQAALSQLAAQEASWVQLRRLPQNQGKGAAVIAGLNWAHALGFSHALQIDADGQHNTQDLPLFFAAAQAQPAAVISGQPVYDASVPKLRLYSRYLTHVWVWINTLSLTIQDSMCGFRIYPLQATQALLQRVQIGRRMDFDTEILVRLCWDGVAIRQIPTAVHYPIDGVSHFDAFKDNVLISYMHTKLFFGMLIRSPRLISRWFI